MAPEKVKIKDERLSPYCSEIKNEHDIKTGNINELTPILIPKKKCCSSQKFGVLFIKWVNIKKST